MDLRIHAEYDPAANTTVEQSAVYKDVVAKTSVMPPLPEDRCMLAPSVSSLERYHTVVHISKQSAGPDLLVRTHAGS